MAIEVLKIDLIDEGNVAQALVRVPAEDKMEMVETSVNALAASVRVAGTAQEKRAALEERVGADRLAEAVSQQVAQLAAAQVITSESLHIMFDPKLTVPRIRGLFESGPAEFVVEMVLRPEYELTSYDPVSVKAQHSVAADYMVESYITQIMDAQATYEPATGALAPSDYAKMDMEVAINGNRVAALSGKNKSVPIDRDTMPGGFVEGVLGMEAGESRSFDFVESHPDDPSVPPNMYHVDVTLIERRRRIIPALTDKYVRQHFADVGTTVPEFREGIRAMLQEQLDQQDVAQRQNVAVQELAKRFKGSLPNVIMERAASESVGRLRNQLAAQGMTLEKFMRQQGMNQQSFQMMTMMQARTDLRQGLALDALYRHLGLQVEERDVDEALVELTGMDPVAARTHFESIGAWFVVNDLAERFRARRWLMDTAIIEE